MKRNYNARNIEEICKAMERNVQTAWDTFVRRVYEGSSFVKAKNLSKFPERDEIHKDLTNEVIEEVIKKKAELLNERESCAKLISNAITKVMYKARDYFKRKINNLEGIDPERPPVIATWTPDIELAELVEKILDENLPKLQASAFRYSVLGYSYKEISEILGSTESAVGTFVGNVRKVLREKLSFYRK